MRAALFAVAAAVVMPNAALATEVTLRHQGRLLDGTGVPVDGNYPVTFRISNGGTVVFEELENVDVEAGYYAVGLGDAPGNPLTASMLAGSPELSIQVGSSSFSAPQPLGTTPIAALATGLGGSAHLDLVRTRLDVVETNGGERRYWQDGILDGFGSSTTVDPASTATWDAGAWSVEGFSQQNPGLGENWNYYPPPWSFSAGSTPNTTTVTKLASYEHVAYLQTNLGSGYVAWGFTHGSETSTDDRFMHFGLIDDHAVTDPDWGSTPHYNNEVPAGTAWYAMWRGAGTGITMRFYRGSANQGGAGYGTTNLDGSATVDVASGDHLWIERDPNDGNAVKFYINDTVVHEFSDTPTIDLYGWLGHARPSDTWPVFYDVYYATLNGAPENADITSTIIPADTSPATATVALVVSTPLEGTIGVDITASVSRDGGTTWTSVPLVDQGLYTDSTRLLAGNAAFTGPDGTALRWRVQTANSTVITVEAVSLNW